MVRAGSTKHKHPQDGPKTLVHPPTLDGSECSRRNNQHNAHHCAPITSYLLNQKLESQPHTWHKIPKMVKKE